MPSAPIGGGGIQLANNTSTVTGTGTKYIALFYRVLGGTFLRNSTGAAWRDWKMGCTHRNFSDRIYIHAGADGAWISPHYH